jgi:hypothetical protein
MKKVVVGLIVFGFLGCEVGNFSHHGNEYSTDDGYSSPETLVGAILVRTLDGKNSSRTQHLLTTPEDQRVILRFDAPASLQTGEKVEVSGAFSDDGQFTVTSLRRLDRRPYRLDTPLNRSPKDHRTVILAMAEASVSEQRALEVFNGSPDSLKRFYAETSYGVDTFSDAIFRQYSITYSSQNCQWDNTYDISDALIAAFEKEGNKASDYDHIVCVVPTSCGSDWDGAWAEVGGIDDQGALYWALISMYKDDCVDPWFLAHELGHNLGMNHSRSVDCGSVLYKPAANGCEVDEYGNNNDLMGFGEGVYFSTPYQRYLGWMGPSNVVTAAKSDIFNLQPADGEMCGFRAVRIPIPGENGSYFYVEYRLARPDSRYAGTGEFGKARQNAVLVLISRDGAGGDDSSNVDRVELGTPINDGAMPEVRYDLGQGVAVTVLSMNGAFAKVAVELPGSGPHHADDGSVVPAENDGSIGQQSCDPIADTDTGSDLDTGHDTSTGNGSDPDPNSDPDTDATSDSGTVDDPGLVKESGSSSCGCHVPGRSAPRFPLTDWLMLLF